MRRRAFSRICEMRGSCEIESFEWGCEIREIKNVEIYTINVVKYNTHGKLFVFISVNFTKPNRK